MSQELRTAVDRYLTELFVQPDPILEAVLRASDAAGLPPHHVTPSQGKLLMLLAQIQRARNSLEIGTLGAYSTVWLARALPVDGRLITLEADPKHAAVARENIAHAGFAGIVELKKIKIKAACWQRIPAMKTPAVILLRLLFPAAMAAGNSDASRLFSKITAADVDKRMPPASEAERLTAD